MLWDVVGMEELEDGGGIYCAGVFFVGMVL